MNVSDTLGHHRALSLLFPGSRCFYELEDHPGVENMIALTIDDAPCSQKSSDKCLAGSVGALLAEFDAKATFFLCTDFVDGHEEELSELLVVGHEIANHCPADRSYWGDSEEAFETALLKSEAVCEQVRRSAGVCVRCQCPRWFRAPQGKLSVAMKSVLERHSFTNVYADCYANDPWIPDVDFIAARMLERVSSGSIAVIHMPEVSFREYNLAALRKFLEGVREKGLRVVTLSTLHEAA